MTEKEKMLSGQLHTFDDEEIILDAKKTEKSVWNITIPAVYLLYYF